MADLFKLMGTIAVDNSKANASIDETTSKAEGAGKRQSSAFSKVASAAGTLATGVVAVGGTMVAAAGSMLALSVGTEDYAVQQGKLQTAFETTGKTAEQAQSTFMGLQGVLGDSDRAVEAAGNIAQIAKSQQDLDKWTTICTGAFATFGDGLPVEGLAEAANETARTGVVTGSLADALNWTSASMDTWNAAMSGHSAAQAAFNSAVESGMSKEDAFSEALKACTTEQERAQLVTDTLNGLYSEAGAKYGELNADLIASRQAQAEWNAVIGQAGEAVRPFATALMETGVSLATALMPYLTQFANWAATALPVIVEGFTTFGAMIGEVIAAAAPIVQQFFAQFQTATPFIQSLWNVLTAICTTIASVLVPVLQTVLPIIISVVQTIVATVVPAVTNIFNTISTVLTALQPLVQAAMSFIQSVFQTVWPHIQSVVQNVMNIISTVVSTVMGVIQGIITAIMGVISGDWSAVWQGISQVANSIWSGIQNIVQSAINIVKSVISGALSLIQSLWSSAWNAVSNVLNNAWNGIKSAVSGAIDGVVGFMSGLQSRVTGAIAGIGSWLSQAGRDLINGLKNGIMGAIDGVVSAVKGGVDRVISAAKGLLGIASPSKVFKEIGDFTMQGMAVGIEKETPLVVRTMGRSVDDVVSAADDIAVSTPQTAYAATSQGSVVESLQADISRLYGLLSDYLPRILSASDTQLVLDTGELVGATAAAYDERLGVIARRRARGQ